MQDLDEEEDKSVDEPFNSALDEPNPTLGLINFLLRRANLLPYKIR
jgi:hypothetical protein